MLCNKIIHTEHTVAYTISPTFTAQSNLSYPGALGLGGAHNSDLSISQNTI